MTDYIRENQGKIIPKINIFSHFLSRTPLKNVSDKILSLYS